MKASVIIPVWNKVNLTRDFISAHLRLKLKPHEMIVVNNGSTDGTKALLTIFKSQYQPLVTKHLPENTGFPGGNNCGAQVASGDILIFISNDVTPIGDYITPIVQAIQSDPAALYGAELLSYDTGWNNFEPVGVIPYLAGWLLACHKLTWARLDGFDEAFSPCDYEDLDLSYRADQMGIALRPLNLPLRHAFGQTAMQLDRLSITNRNRAYFAKKHGLRPKEKGSRP